MKRPIVVVGGGFAGVVCAQALERRLPRDQEIILVSAENHICFTPLLAEVAGGSVSPSHVVWPVRQMVRRTVCRTAEVCGLDPAARTVAYRGPRGEMISQAYEHLVLACGLASDLGRVPGMGAHGFPLKRLGDALVLGNHVIGQLERAEVEPDVRRRRALLTFAVVGGGFSGAEVAGELNDLLRASCRYYPSIHPDEPRVILLHGGDRLLPELPPKLGRYARRKLLARRVDVRLNTRVAAVSEAGIRLADGADIPAATVIGTIGNATVSLVATAGLPLDRGRIVTAPDMRVIGHQDVWAIGDCAAVPNAAGGAVCPPLAQFATRQADQLADNLVAALAGRPTRAFRYVMKGSFAAIGGRKAVGDVFGVRITGFAAWFIWRGFYLSRMPTLARKVQIAFDWLWALLFPRGVVYLDPTRTRRTARAHFEPGQWVYRRGDPADRFYTIERGRAGLYSDEAAGPAAVRGPGDYFGEWELLRSGPRADSVRAESPLDVLVVDEPGFRAAVAGIGFFRAEVERAVGRQEAVRRIWDLVRTHPRLADLRVRDVIPPVDRLGPPPPGTTGCPRGPHNPTGDVSEGQEFAVTSQAPTSVDNPATAPVPRLAEDTRLAEVLPALFGGPATHWVVTRGEGEGVPIGILTLADVLRAVAGLPHPAGDLLGPGIPSDDRGAETGSVDP